jgi:hypothetical protein
MVASQDPLAFPSPAAIPNASQAPARRRSDEVLAVGRSATGTDPAEQLGQLDDAVFEAIAGHAEALDGLRQLWPEIKAKLGTRLVDESRDQYVRYALRVWRESLAGAELRNPTAALAVIDVMSLLFDE